MKAIERYKTAHGEYTLYLPDLDETYHSRDGAISESEHVFIKHGLLRCKQDPIRVLEVGFGTGLNALLTALRAKNRQVHYCALEPFPLSKEIWSGMNYAQFLDADADQLYKQLHEAAWNKAVQISPSFQLLKLKQRLQDLSNTPLFHLVYFDAFAPKKQGELWEASIFEQVYKLLAAGGIFTTYSAAGQLKRNLRTAGFQLEHPAGANGKREMTVAVKT